MSSREDRERVQRGKYRVPSVRTWHVETHFGYDLCRTCEEIRPGYTFQESCQGTVPEAIIAFLDSTDFESAIRLAVSLGGDSDTLACITGGLAEAYYKEIPEENVKEMWSRLPETFREILRKMKERFGGGTLGDL